MVKQISDNEIYLLIKYIKSVLCRVVKCLSYIQEARCLKVNITYFSLALSVDLLRSGFLNKILIYPHFCI